MFRMVFFAVSLFACVNVNAPANAGPIRTTIRVIDKIIKSTPTVRNAQRTSTAISGSTRVSNTFRAQIESRAFADSIALSTRLSQISTPQAKREITQLAYGKIAGRKLLLQASDDILSDVTTARLFLDDAHRIMASLAQHQKFLASSFPRSVSKSDVVIWAQKEAAKPKPAFTLDVSSGKLTINKSYTLGNLKIDAGSINLYKIVAVTGVPVGCLATNCPEALIEAGRNVLNDRAGTIGGPDEANAPIQPVEKFQWPSEIRLEDQFGSVGHPLLRLKRTLP